MKPIRRILVAVKSLEGPMSPAVVKAGQLAQSLGASVELFHAIVTPQYLDAYSPTGVDFENTERDVQQRCLAQLDVIAKRMRRQAIEVTVAAEWDFPGYEAVIRRAKRIKADLIVANLHAGGPLFARMLHLTDWELLRLSATPVLLVKTKTRYRQPVVLAAVDPTHTRSKPAALDDEILSLASTITDTLHGTLHALHAYAPAPTFIWPSNAAAAAALPNLMKQAARKAKLVLDHAASSAEIPRSRRHVVGRHPVDAIEQTASQIHASIVVMGAVSRSGLKGLFIGNTAERVLDSLACDVLIVKPADFKERVSRTARGVNLISPASMAFPM
jgi:universal stress protein E